jgi:hypothetical protein
MENTTTSNGRLQARGRPHRSSVIRPGEGDRRRLGLNGLREANLKRLRPLYSTTGLHLQRHAQQTARAKSKQSEARAVWSAARQGIEGGREADGGALAGGRSVLMMRGGSAPVAAPAAEKRCVFQEADQTMPRCCFCWFLQLNASHEAKDAPLQVQN